MTDKKTCVLFRIFQVWGLGLVLETSSGSRICCATISSQPSVWDSTILTTVLVLAGLLLLALLLAGTLYCCCYRRSQSSNTNIIIFGPV